MARDVEARDRFLTLVCSGMSLKRAGQVVAVSSAATTKWWRESVSMKITPGKNRHGGLAAAPVADCPGAGRVPRALSIHDRQVIASGVRQGMSHSTIGSLIGRNKSLICQEVNRHRGPDSVYYPAVAHSGGRGIAPNSGRILKSVSENAIGER